MDVGGYYGLTGRRAEAIDVVTTPEDAAAEVTASACAAEWPMTPPNGSMRSGSLTTADTVSPAFTLSS
jgi:hypothetical protein